MTEKNATAVPVSPGLASQAHGFSRLTGSAVAGVAEIIIFHPIDTVAKRLISNQQRMFQHGDKVARKHSVLKVIFADAHDKGLWMRWKNLYPGIAWAGAYKVCGRIAKFGGQPYVNDYLIRGFGHHPDNTSSRKFERPFLQAVAGAAVGVGECVLLPLDVMKIKRQTNPGAIAELTGGGSMFKAIRNDPALFVTLYRGAGWTAARNAVGSFALFGGSAWAKEHLLGIAFDPVTGKPNRTATMRDHFVGSTLGSVTAIIACAPLDVIKVRVQNKGFKQRVSGMSIVRDLMLHEGPLAFFKGLTPKLITAAPKLIFSMTVAQGLIQRIHDATGR